MAILVDELRAYPGVRMPFSVWCHMATDGSFDELHEFAGRLGLRRGWFQRDHYDLPAHGRAAAVELGAEEVTTAELLLRMAGPRGDRARRRALAPAGVVWLRGVDGPTALRYPRGALVVIGGPSAAGKSMLAARVVDGVRVLDPDETRAAPGPEAARGSALHGLEELRATLAGGRGAVAVTPALRQGHRLGLAEAAAAAGVGAHLVMLDADAGLCRAGRAAQSGKRIPDGRFEHLIGEWEAYRRTLAGTVDPAPYDSITVVDRDAADRLHRITLSPYTRT